MTRSALTSRCCFAVLVLAMASSIPASAQAADPAAEAVSDDTTSQAAGPTAETTTTAMATTATATTDVDGEASTEDDVVLRHRTPIQALNEHFVGTTARAVRFDWRRSTVMVGWRIDEVLERNNFGQWRTGAVVRKALGDVILDGGVHYYQSYDTPSSQTLALTPFRQAGRPDHFELDFNVGYAVAEGVVTPLASFLPPAEIVLVPMVGARYLIYPRSFIDRDLQAIGLSLVNPVLTDEELVLIERDALESMKVDRSRLQVLAGLGLDVYLQPGVFVSPRAMIAIPLLGVGEASAIGPYWELGLQAGWAF